MPWPQELKFITWTDRRGVTHLFRQSKNHVDDWDTCCTTVRYWGLRPRDALDEIRAVQNHPRRPVTCLECATFTE